MHNIPTLYAGNPSVRNNSSKIRLAGLLDMFITNERIKQ